MLMLVLMRELLVLMLMLVVLSTEMSMVKLFKDALLRECCSLLCYQCMPVELMQTDTTLYL